jgi:UDP-N-acetylglucosamine 4-epimerase
MPRYSEVQHRLSADPETWLVTGGAGFIGSHVVEQLLRMGQKVRVLDDESTGYSKNLEAAKQLSGAADPDLQIIHGDIREKAICETAVQGVDRIVHLAAMASVPLSMEQPQVCNDINVSGTLNLLEAGRRLGAKRLVYASSSAVYGDDTLPAKIESSLGRTLSPYAASKYINEVYAAMYTTAYGLPTVGCRFFNVFGPRQDPAGAYAAVIPCWIDQMKKGEPVYINGDGGNTRDFCFVRDVVQALILGATCADKEAHGRAFNVGLGKATDLNELFQTLRTLVHEATGKPVANVIYRDFRAGDIRHSCANTEQITKVLEFNPGYSLMDGLRETVQSILG